MFLILFLLTLQVFILVLSKSVAHAILLFKSLSDSLSVFLILSVFGQVAKHVFRSNGQTDEAKARPSIKCLRIFLKQRHAQIFKDSAAFTFLPF
jgi:hypothetical protein